MKEHLIIIAIGAAAIFCPGCSTPQSSCSVETFPFELSLSKPNDSLLSLVSISDSGLVTVRLREGKLAQARVGEEFKLADGSRVPGDYRLRSVDISSGLAVVEEVNFVIRSR